MSISGPDPDRNQPGQPAANTTSPTDAEGDVAEQVGRPSSPAAGSPEHQAAPSNADPEKLPPTRPLDETAEQPIAPPPPAPAPSPTPEPSPPAAQTPPVTPPEATAEQPPITPPPPTQAPPPAAPVPPELSEPYGESQAPAGAWEQPETPDRVGWQPRPHNGFGIAALILGILSILLFAGLGIILGLIGIIFGVLGILRGLRGEATNNGMSITGVVLSAVGLALGGLVAGFAAAVLPSIDGCFDKDNYPTAHERNECVKDNLPGWVPVND